MAQFSEIDSNVPKKKPVKETAVETFTPDLLSSSDEDDWSKISKRAIETIKTFDDLFNDNKNDDISDKKDSNDNTKNEIDSLKRQLDERTKELQNMREEQKSEQNDLQVKINAQDLKIEILEDSKAKLQKLKQLLATKIFLVNPKGENLESLIHLEIEDLFSKYDQSVMVQDAFKVEFLK